MRASIRRAVGSATVVLVGSGLLMACTSPGTNWPVQDLAVNCDEFYSPQLELANLESYTHGTLNDGVTYSLYSVDGAGAVLYENEGVDQVVFTQPFPRFDFATPPTQNPVVAFGIIDEDPYDPSEFPEAYGIGRCEGLPFATSLWRTDFATTPVADLPTFFVALDDYAPFSVGALEVSGTAQAGSLSSTIEYNLRNSADETHLLFNYPPSVYPDQSDPLVVMRQFASYVQRVSVGSAVGDGTIIVSLPASVLAGLSDTTNLASNELTIILDRGAPEIETRADVTVTVDWDATSGVASFTPPSADDHGTAMTSVCLPASGSTFPVGNTTVTCTATDDANNSDSSTFTVSVVQDPPPVLDEIIISGDAAAIEGEMHSYSVAGLDQYGDPFPVPAGVVFSSSYEGDAVVDGEVSFGFDPAAIGGSSVRTITASVGSDPVFTDSIDVEVTTTATGIELATTDGKSSVAQGGSLEFEVTAVDENGQPLGDASSVVELSSSVDTDEVSGTSVTFPHASPHTITATVIPAPEITDSLTLEVIPPTEALGATGADFPTVIAGTTAVLALLGTVIIGGVAVRRTRLG